MVENPKNNPVLYPPDRRIHFWIRPSILTILLIVALVPIALAWIQYLILGLPDVPASPRMMPEVASAPHGFPAWLRITHYINFFFIVLLARSGLSILVAVHRCICASSARTATATTEDRLVLHGKAPQFYLLRAA